MKNAIAVLANKEHLEKARQVITSCHINGNWKGSYILLAHEITDPYGLTWFHENNIHIIHIKNLREHGLDHHHPTSIYYSKLYLFHPKLSEWGAIVYLDNDMIVRKDLGKLLKYKTFAAADDCCQFPLSHQFYFRDVQPQKLEQLLNGYNWGKTAFNAGMMVIDSRNNSTERYQALLQLVREYAPFSTYGDQGILNLYFQGKRKRIPYIYNDFYQSDDFNRQGLFFRSSDAETVILHLTYPFKPWDPRSKYINEWEHNMGLSNSFRTNGQIGEEPSALSALKIDMINQFNTWRVKTVYWLKQSISKICV